MIFLIKISFGKKKKKVEAGSQDHLGSLNFKGSKNRIQDATATLHV